MIQGCKTVRVAGYASVAKFQFVLFVGVRRCSLCYIKTNILAIFGFLVVIFLFSCCNITHYSDQDPNRIKLFSVSMYLVRVVIYVLCVTALVVVVVWGSQKQELIL